jgi:3-dehydroquinate dehydratase-1
MSTPQPNHALPYCLPIQCSTKAEVFKVLDENQHLFPYLEVWLGSITDLDDGLIRPIVELYGSRVIFVLRTKGSTIDIRGARAERLLEEASAAHATVDLDIHLQRDELHFLKTRGLPIQLITSYHNYESTPSLEKLNSLCEEMRQYAPSIYKFSTYCEQPEDALQILQLGISLRKQGLRTIALGMGPHGAATRIFGTLWGNELIYAPRDAIYASAPGQFTQQELEQVCSIITRCNRS